MQSLAIAKSPSVKTSNMNFHQQSMRTNFPSFAPECNAVLSFCQLDGLSVLF